MSISILNSTFFLDLECAPLFCMFWNYTNQNNIFEQISLLFTADGELSCLYASSGGSYVYQHVLNMDATTDESTTYRITCLVRFFYYIWSIKGTDGAFFSYLFSEHVLLCPNLFEKC